MATFVELVLIMFIRIEAILLSGTVEFTVSMIWWSNGWDLWIKITNLFFYIKDQLMRADKAIGKSTSDAFIVDVRIFWIDDIVTLFVSFADVGVGGSDGCDGGRIGSSGGWNSCWSVRARG